MNVHDVSKEMTEVRAAIRITNIRGLLVGINNQFTHKLLAWLYDHPQAISDVLPVNISKNSQTMWVSDSPQEITLMCTHDERDWVLVPTVTDELHIPQIRLRSLAVSKIPRTYYITVGSEICEVVVE